MLSLADMTKCTTVEASRKMQLGRAFQCMIVLGKFVFKLVLEGVYDRGWVNFGSM